MKINLLSLGILILPLAACSPMNSHFSCNKTAGDSCLNIEEVDAMTSFADDNNREGYRANARKMLSNGFIAREDKSLWLSQNIKGQQWA